MEKTILYNGSCPICSREVAVYRDHAEAVGADLQFSDLQDADLEAWGLTRDEAAREFHVAHNGRIVGGVDAFLLLWSDLPRFRWLARFVGAPVIRPMANVVYRHILAPILFAMHKRREARKAA